MYSKMQIAKNYNPKCRFPYYLKLILATTKSQSYILVALLQKIRIKQKNQARKRKRQERKRKEKKRREGEKGEQQFYMASKIIQNLYHCWPLHWWLHCTAWIN